ncbi:beta-carotene hydroxylase [bacterium]|nr:beta-carotene hydroxylase [bacterium]
MAILVFILTFFFMEFVAWAAHKYVMHGFLWNLHKDHHVKENPNQFIEHNDSFFVIFATPAALSLSLGNIYGMPFANAIGFGICAYGLCYFLVHDIFIHQRFKLFRKTDNAYFRAIRRAHKIHHKHLGKEDGECFGMLLVPMKYIQAEWSKKK